MQCLIGLDGLSPLDVPVLLELLPRSRKLLEQLRVISFSSSSVTAQAAWGELLTGTNCFLNGCGGYARPTSSLNKLAVFTEADLLEPAKLVAVSGHFKSVTINVPILQPKPADRIWLSDGSLPTNKFFSPSELRSDSTIREYVARPYKFHAGALSVDRSSMVQRCLEIEAHRLSCAVSLFKKKNWSKFLFRLGVFDYLSHLIGLNFLAAKDLSSFEAIKKFLGEFDNAIRIFSADESLRPVFVSCYSHVPCSGTLNLNLVLANAGFLKLLPNEEAAERTQTERLNVATALWKPSSHYLMTMEGRVDTSSSVAASPVSGCVFINKRSVFDDGIVDEGSYKKVRTQVSSYLHSFLLERFGNTFSLEVHPADVNNSCAPDLIVKIEGVEFHNLSVSASQVTPLTTHSSEGFAMVPKQLWSSDNMRATQLASLLNS